MLLMIANGSGWLFICGQPQSSAHDNCLIVLQKLLNVAPIYIHLYAVRHVFLSSYQNGRQLNVLNDKSC